MSWAEQDEVDHGAPELWIVAPGHQPQGAKTWRAVRATDRFVVLEVQEADTITPYFRVALRKGGGQRDSPHEASAF